MADIKNGERVHICGARVKSFMPPGSGKIRVSSTYSRSDLKVFRDAVKRFIKKPVHTQCCKITCLALKTLLNTSRLPLCLSHLVKADRNFDGAC